MSRVGRSPIPVPAGVDIGLSERQVTVTGPQGTLARSVPEGITVDRDGDVLVVTRADDERQHRALHGLTRSLVANMVTGVTQGFTKELEIVGVGYRATARGAEGIELALGFSHPVVVDAPTGISFEVPSPTRIVVKGIDKELVGQVAADIRKIRKPEPYKGKGVRYAGERVLRKAGKGSEMTDTTRKERLRQRRHNRVRRKVAGTAERPRLAVHRSLRHIAVQVVDDTTGRTLAAASTVDAQVRDGLGSGGGGNVSAAAAVGKLVASRAKAAGVTRVVFDRGGFAYHGRIAALADAAREEGLEF